MNDLFQLVMRLYVLLDKIIPILIGLAVLLFLYGLLRYIISDNKETRKEAINVIVYGIVALFLMVSIWGVVAVIGDTLDITPGGSLYQEPIIIDQLIKK